MGRTLTGSITPSQSGPESGGNEEYSTFPKFWRIIIKCSLMSYLGYSLGVESYPSPEVQWVYSTAPAEKIGMEVLHFYRIFGLIIHVKISSKSLKVTLIWMLNGSITFL